MLFDLMTSGLGLLQQLETIRHPVLDAIFQFLSVLGREPGYLVLVPLVYWRRGDAVGLKIMAGLILCWFLNAWIKELIQEPRPFLFGTLTPLDHVTDHSFPSGHAQLAAFFWVYVALVTHHVWVRVLAATLILGIGFSRLYLGVHFPHDVVAGWLLGLILALAATACPVPDVLSKRQRSLSLLLPPLMIALLPTLDCIRLAGTLTGVLLGYRYGPLPTVMDTGVRYRLAGIALACVLGEFALYKVAKLATTLSGPILYVGTFLAYAALGGWIARSFQIVAHRIIGRRGFWGVGSP